MTAVIGEQTDDAMQVIEARAEAVGAPLKRWGREFEAFEQHGRLVYQDELGLIDLPPPRLFGRHQIANAGIAIAALRWFRAALLPRTTSRPGLRRPNGRRGLSGSVPASFTKWSVARASCGSTVATTRRRRGSGCCDV